MAEFRPFLANFGRNRKRGQPVGEISSAGLRSFPFSPSMPCFTTDPACPKCGGPSDFVEKNTFTGQEIREYRGGSWGHLFAEYGGTALWQVLRDDNVARAGAERLRAKKPWWKFWKR